MANPKATSTEKKDEDTPREETGPNAKGEFLQKQEQAEADYVAQATQDTVPPEAEEDRIYNDAGQVVSPEVAEIQERQKDELEALLREREEGESEDR